MTENLSQSTGKKSSLSELKQSKALSIWFLVVSIVLLALFLETRGQGRPAYNVAVSMNESELSQAELFVDGNRKGQFNLTREDWQKEGHTAACLYLKLANGRHRLELKKDGQTVREKSITVKGKEYVRFDSGRGSQAGDRGN